MKRRSFVALAVAFGLLNAGLSMLIRWCFYG
jgi:hypothetical protein